MSDKLVGRPFPEKLVADLVNEREEKVKKKNNMNDKAINGIIDEKKKQKQEKIETRNKAVVNIVNEKKEKKEQFNKLANKAIELAKKRKSSNSVNAVTSVDMISKAPNDAVVTNGSFGGDMSVTESTNFDKAISIVSAKNSVNTIKDIEDLLNLLNKYKNTLQNVNINNANIENVKNGIDSILNMAKNNKPSDLVNVLSLKNNEFANNISLILNKKNGVDVNDRLKDINNIIKDYINYYLALDNNANNEKNIIDNNIFKKLKELQNILNKLGDVTDKNKIEEIKNCQTGIENIFDISQKNKIGRNKLVINLNDENIISNLKLVLNTDNQSKDVFNGNEDADKISDLINIRINYFEKVSKSIKRSKNKVEINFNDVDSRRLKRLNEVLGDKNEARTYLDAYNRANISKTIPNDDDIPYGLNEAWKDMLNLNSNIAIQILNYIPKGQGKGEFFIEFAFSDAQSLGGMQSYDIITKSNKKYEVKGYSDINKRIRLGTEGKAFNFDSYVALYTLYDSISKLLNMDELKFNILISMITSAYDKLKGVGIKYPENLRSYMINLFTNSSGSNYLSRLRSGEFNSSELLSTQKVFNTVKIIVDAVQANNFEYAKLINNGEIYVVKNDNKGNAIINKDPKNNTVNIECLNMPASDTNFDKQVIDSISNLRNSIYNAIKVSGVKIDKNNSNNGDIGSEFLKGLLLKISQKITDDFKEHPMILINDKTKTKNDDVCLGLFKEFIMTNVSQGGVSVKVVPENNTMEGMINDYISGKIKDIEEKEEGKVE